MAELYDRKIDKTIDWGGDANTSGAPVTGRRVQEFIKEELEHRAGVFYYDGSNGRYLIFADEINRNIYLNDTSRTDLLIGSFDAPSNYDAVINLTSPTFKAVLFGSTNNYLEFTFDTTNKSGASVGESVTCTYTFVRGGTKTVVTEKYRAGLSVKFNIDQYLQEGANSITIGIVGDTTLAATSVGVTYQVVNLKLSSSYDISTVHNLLANPSSVAEIPYRVSGTGIKTMEWYLDGIKQSYEATDEIVEVESSRSKYISMAGLLQGKHSLQVRTYVTINGEKFYSDTLYMDLIVYTGANRDPIISVATEIPSEYGIVTGTLKLYGVEQYTPYTFKFAVYNATGAASTEATVSVGGVKQGTVNTINNTVYPYTIRINESGSTTLKISAGITNYEINVDVSGSSDNIGENDNSLLLNLYAVGRTNEDKNRDEWLSNGYETTFDGFKWNPTSGWDNNRLVISDGASIEVNLAPFSGRATTTGLTLEMEFSTENVNNDDAVICDLRSTNGNGLLVTASTAQLSSAAGSMVSTKYKSGENIRVAFVVNPSTGVTNKGLVFVYIDGILSGAERFAQNDNFISGALLKIGGTTEAVVRLKHVRIYNSALSSDEVLNNYIIYRDTSEEMMNVYNRNDVMDGRSFNLDALAAQCPVLKVTGDIPTLENTTSKDETIYVDVEYVNMQDPTRSFTGTYLRMRPQGTSSMGYPKKNFRLYTDKHADSRIYDHEGKEIEDRLYSFKKGAQPVNCWCFKADYAESSGTHNTGIARLWNELMYNAQIGGEYKLRTKAQQIAANNGYPYDVRTTVDGFPCHIVYRLDKSSDWIYIGKYNFNNDKSTESVFGFKGIPNFDNSRMQCWEILNNGNHLALFEDVENFDLEWENAYEARYPDDGSSADTTDLKAFCEWVVSTKNNVEKFKTEKWSHLDVYKAAAYYIYVMRFGAVDQTVKNSMLTSEDGEHFYWINYDNDTINGLRNDGLLAFDFTIDRNSLDPNYNVSPDPEHEVQVYAYAGHNSTLWNNMEADSEFMQIVAEVDQALYTAGLSYANVIKMFDDEQSAKWNERVYNQDAQYKYIGPYTNEGVNNLFMLQGARRAHRRWWLSHRFDLIDSKFISGKFKSNIIDFKVMNDTQSGQQFTIEAGNLLYYGYGVNDIPTETGVRLDKGESHTFTTVQVLNIGDPVRIYSAPNIRSLDLNKLMSRLTQLGVGGVYDEENGSKLKNLIIGNGTSVNQGLSEISGLPQAKELEVLDIRGCLGLGSVNISGLKALKIFRAQNSGLTTFIPAVGALLNEVYLPSSITGITLNSLAYLNELNVENAGKNLATIQISNCPSLTNDFTFFYNWYRNKTTANRLCTVELDNINWQGLTPQQLIDFGQILADGGTLNLKGKAVITESSEEIVHQLSAIYGENVFNSTSEFFISAPSAIYLTGPDEVLEGSSAQYVAAVFGDNQGTIQWSIISGGTSYQSIDQYGLLTTKYQGSARTITIQAKHYPTVGDVVTMTKNVNILKQIRPTGGTISGDEAASDGSEYTLAVSPSDINTEYSVAWSLSGAAYDNGYVSIDSQDKDSCKLSVVAGGIGSFNIVATITDVAGNTRTVTKELSLGITLTVKMTSNQTDDTSLSSVKATVLVGSNTHTVTNGGTLTLMVGATVKITFNAVDGYTTPSVQEFVVGSENITKTGVYNTTLVYVNITDNQSGYNDIANSTATVSATGMTTKTISNGGHVKVPLGASCTIVYSALNDYKKPSNDTFTTSGTSMTRNGLYLTEVVVVSSVTTSDNASTNGVTITINGTSYTWNGSTIRHKVPFDVAYSVVASSKEGYNSPSESFTASIAERSVSLVYTPQIGSHITIDQTITDPATMISGDVNGEHIQLIRSNSHRYLGKYTSEGTMTLCQLSDSDSNKYNDGTTADLTGGEGDVFMKMPQFWYKSTELSTDVWDIAFYFGETCPQEGWIKWDTNVLIGVYEAYITGSKLYSRSGIESSGNITYPKFKAYASNRGNGFQLVDWQMHCVMAILFYAQYGHVNSQEKIGAGTRSNIKKCGQTNANGMNDTKGAIPVIGLNDAGADGNAQSINFWGLENWWGNKNELIDNVVVDAYEWKITETDGTVRTPVFALKSNDWIGKLMFGANCDLIPTDGGGSATSGFCDYYPCSDYTNNILVQRSYFFDDAYGGVAFVAAVFSSASSLPNCGSRLAFRGQCVEAESVETFKSLTAIG